MSHVSNSNKVTRCIDLALKRGLGRGRIFGLHRHTRIGAKGVTVTVRQREWWEGRGPMQDYWRDPQHLNGMWGDGPANETET